MTELAIHAHVSPSEFKRMDYRDAIAMHERIVKHVEVEQENMKNAANVSGGHAKFAD